MLQWARHLQSQDPRFHRVDSSTPGGSVVTRCRGRWPESDAVEQCDAPAKDERCQACDRTLMAGAPLVDDRFDFGGES